MSGMAKPVAYIADHLRHVLVNGASAPHTAEVEWFFKNEIQSRGWYTGELRKLARRFSRVILHDASLDYLVQVADQLFQGNVLEEKVLAVLLLQPSAAKCTPQHFELFCTWLQRVSTWADHDGLVQYLIGPMIVLDPQRRRRIYSGRPHPTAGTAAPRPSPSCAAPTSDSSTPTSAASPNYFSTTKTSWCKRDSAGC